MCQALFKNGNTAHDACAVALREPLCERDSVFRFLPREAAIDGETRLDSHSHSGSESYRMSRMAH